MGSAVLAILLVLSAHATESPVVLQTITVTDDEEEQGRGSNALARDAWNDRGQIERVSSEDAQKRAATRVPELIASQPGVDIQVSCANCGAKRIALGGLRGEYTTILVDGVPLHSSVSSLYGLDAIPLAGIEAVEITRGTGASQLAPEAIGGVVNIVTQTARGNAFSALGTFGNAGTRTASLVTTRVSDGARNRLVLSAQGSSAGLWAGNGVSQFPETGNVSVLAKASRDLTRDLTVELRYSYQSLDTLGGTTTGFRPTGPRAGFSSNVTQYSLFPMGDVRNAFQGDPSFITDWIQLQRHEAGVHTTLQASPNWRLKLVNAAAYHDQSAIYMHGYDYGARDRLFFSDLRAQAVAGDHIVTFGFEARDERMRSRSDKLFGEIGLSSDSFNYRTAAALAQDAWYLFGDRLELLSAIRAEHIRLQRTEDPDGSLGIGEWFVAPRVQAKWRLGQDWSTSLAYGRGYRAPLGFFDSQHGLSERGFETGVNRLETSNGVRYDLAYAGPKVGLRGSAGLTWLGGMAYAEQDVPVGSPVVFRNIDETYVIRSAEIGADWALTRNLELKASAEKFWYPLAYSLKLPTAAIEERAVLEVDWHRGAWDIGTRLTWIGSRDLGAYRYFNRFDTLSYTEDPFNPGDPTFAEVRGRDAKSLRAPTFATLDLHGSYQIAKWLKASVQVQNLFDTTQAGMGSSPLNWNQHGSDAEHFHLDNNFLWGPLRGRIWTVGLRADL